jgi:LamB/YcsF family
MDESSIDLNADVARAEGTSVRHVKAHEALNNVSVIDADLAQAIVDAVLAVDAPGSRPASLSRCPRNLLSSSGRARSSRHPASEPEQP